MLPIVHRQPAPLRALTSARSSSADRHGGGGSAAGRRGVRCARCRGIRLAARPARPHRGDQPGPRVGRRSPALLREEHLDRDVPWSQLAVIVRSSAHAPGIARALALAEVPTRTASGGVALRDETAARGLLALVEVGVGRTELTAELATELLLSAFGGLDALGLRRLRLALRAEELAGDGNRTSDALLVEALSGARPIRDDRQPAGASGRAPRRDARRPARSATARSRICSGSPGIAADWRSPGTIRRSAAVRWPPRPNRNLDAVVALFTAAKRFAERRPDAPAFEFLAEVLDAEVPEDVLSPRGAATTRCS